MLRWFRRLLIRAGWLAPRAADIPGVVLLNPAWAYDHYRWWWRDLAAQLVNAGLSLRQDQYASVVWYACDALPEPLLRRYLRALNGTLVPSATNMAGIWLSADNEIVLTHRSLMVPSVVRHEMTHAMRGEGGHDHTWFKPEYNNVP